MSDLSRYLPLSNRPRHDESSVDPSWNAELAEVLGGLSTALASRPDDAWSGAAQRPGWTVHEVVAHLAWRLSTPRGERWRTSARSLAEQGFSAVAADLAIARRVAASDDGSPTALPARLANLPSAGPGALQHGIGALAEAVVATLDVSASLDLPIAVPGRATGAVALRRALEAPTEIKAVIRGHTLVATDADWSFGHGPVLEGTAAELVLFLHGRSTAAPRPAR
ncbi:uncharacterized protein (TIGR03083 family) [Agromyces terreus]|uniref:Uncharacterized protein (TIGR03083 family) n=1 Tax=Agromyces terreus TaxID=424795 RepID=A0A9X2GYQ3_9MICO|nr:hypothetical protein [Agromyces terreus]MCP2369793.1 uncharacterized protein (TIGR03083 family) [Agromyces terreus]